MRGSSIEEMNNIVTEHLNNLSKDQMLKYKKRLQQQIDFYLLGQKECISGI